MRRGFTLLEVVIALLVLELVAMGAVGLLVLASSTLARAEQLERAVALTEGMLDSLAQTRVRADGAASYGPGEVRWSLAPDGVASLIATGPLGDTLFEVGAVLPP